MHANGGESEQGERDCEPGAVDGGGEGFLRKDWAADVSLFVGTVHDTSVLALYLL